MEDRTLAQIIEEESTRERHKGWSFTYGLALQALMHDSWRLPFKLADELLDLIETTFDEPARMLQEYRLHSTLPAWASLLDLSDLDAVARQIVGIDGEAENE